MSQQAAAWAGARLTGIRPAVYGQAGNAGLCLRALVPMAGVADCAGCHIDVIMARVRREASSADEQQLAITMMHGRCKEDEGICYSSCPHAWQAVGPTQTMLSRQRKVDTPCDAGGSAQGRQKMQSP